MRSRAVLTSSLWMGLGLGLVAFDTSFSFPLLDHS